MYHDDIRPIIHYAWESPETMYRTLLFVRLSIQKRLERVRPLLDMVCADGPGILVNTQERRSCEELAGLATRFISGYPNRQYSAPLLLLQDAIKTHGLGIPKSGFIVQLLTGHIGCLDSHNVKMHSITKRFRLDASWRKIEAQILEYVLLCDHLGGSQGLWDGWCQYVSLQRPGVWPTAEHVSKYHVTTILGV